MNELQELTENKSLAELKKELDFQLKNGENLGGTICSHIQNEIKTLKNKKMKTITEVRQSFWDSYPEFKNEYRKTWRQNQYKTDIRVSFTDHVEKLRRDGVISEKLAQKVTL